MENAVDTLAGEAKLVPSVVPERGLSLTTGPHDQITQSLENITRVPDQVFFPCNNPENIIDERTADRVESLFHMAVLPLLELFGVTTNVLNCLVFARQGLKVRINLCLFSLAVADISFLVCIFAAKAYDFLGLVDRDLGEYWGQRYLNTVLGPMLGTLTISNLMTLIISLERCICVMSPFKAKKFLKTRYMAILIVTMAVYILGIYSLIDIKYVTVRVTDPVTNTSHWVSRLSALYMEQRLVIETVYMYLLNLSVPSLSLLVMALATSITLTRLRTTLLWRRQESLQVNTSLGDKREAAVTKMMTVICLIYMATITPSVMQAFARSLLPGYLPGGKYCNIFVVLQTLAHTCEVTNSSVNFIVYFNMGSRYRQTLRELLCNGERSGATSSSPSKPLPSNNM